MKQKSPGVIRGFSVTGDDATAMRCEILQQSERIMTGFASCGASAAKRPLAGHKTGLLLFCCLSLLSHAFVMQAVIRFAPMNFAGTVVDGRTIVVDLKELRSDVEESKPTLENYQTANPIEDAEVPPLERPTPAKLSIIDEQIALQPTPPVVDQMHSLPAATPDIRPAKSPFLLPPIRKTEEFLGTKREKLSYQISMFGIPVGEALLEAINNKGEFRIISRVKSNAAISLLYPVDNETETRIFNGRFIMTTIKRNEGENRSDVGFTLNLGDKNVFWADRLKKRYFNTKVPTDQVLDMITGFYFLRNQQLEVGKSITLNLFDNNTYAPTPVLVLRKEMVRLPNFREVETFVVQPQLTTGGIFNRTGDLFIWLTADENKVPVKLETSIPLGRVTAELISSESEK